MITFIYEKCPDEVKEWLDKKRKQEAMNKYRSRTDHGQTVARSWTDRSKPV